MKMEIDMKDRFKVLDFMAKANSHIKTACHMMEIGSMVRSMAMEFLTNLVYSNILESG